jgi:hypothetical protein
MVIKPFLTLATVLFALHVFAADFAIYEAQGARFRYPSSEWYVEPGYGSDSTVIRRIDGNATLSAFTGYTSDPGLEQTVSTMLAFGKYARGYVLISREKFYNGVADRKTSNTSAARPNGIRTEYIVRTSEGRPVAIVQYWFTVDEHRYIVITGTCLAAVRNIYDPVFDRIAETVAMK